MTADREHLKVTWVFQVGTTDEIAVTGLNYSLQAGTTFSATVALGEIVTATQGAALAARMGTLLGSANMKWGNYSFLTGVRFAAVGTDGLELAPAKFHTVPGSTHTGNDGDVIPQSSIVLSLRSNQFGPGANYGRMFLPHTSWALGIASPRAEAADVSAFANAAETFIEGCEADLNAVVTEILDTMIISQITGRASRGVSAIALGDIVDTQRRRRNRLPEIYTFRTIT